MELSYARKIEERIENVDDGTILKNADFIDIANQETIRRTLNRLVQAGRIRRVLNGLYEKPKYSKLLDEYVATDPNAVAHTLAKMYRWTIVPSGDTALNMLGLSTQVTSSWSYISDGPYRNFEWDNTKLEFKHRTNKEVSGLSYKTALIIQALKALGKDNITTEVINKIASKLTENEKQALLDEGITSTRWVYDVIRKICGE
ncbi:DUF6088 family protein [Ohessyouella blattaphilus]|uniref:DUF6088 family protein n=1 Tax=Ohessyouella blattaphilus TaxID=2949333 RepID=A0ABT1EJN7_9FIRM|nr:DUF6088 family protein [Ohessyouella blattaphilus]MCP1110909.1 DUF6088 family protein [Ohessyouella blattaphilus]MCR8564303.1 DUF6088 family protein [Ohessyouella blattaphilus]